MSSGGSYSHDEVALAFHESGKGEKKVLAFHGFGQDSSYFECFIPVFEKRYTIYRFDLPFHGLSTFTKKGQVVDREQLKKFYLDFFMSKGIVTFSLVGFSIGAKFALALLEFFPERVERIILIAPDGFKTNPWYRLATGSVLSRAIFRYIIYHPELYSRISDTLVRFKLLHPGVSRFARSQMSSQEKREKVYFTWMYFRKLRFKRSVILRLLKEHSIPMEIFLGKEDKIIRSRHFTFLGNHPDIICKITLLDAGHNDLIQATADQLKLTNQK